MLADAEHIEADLVGQLDLLEQILDPLGIARRAALRGGHKTVYADLHGLPYSYIAPIRPICDRTLPSGVGRAVVVVDDYP